MANAIALEQGSPEWLEYRRTKIGASDIPIIMGKCPPSWRTSAYKLWQIKTGRIPEQVSNSAMQRGIELEPVARLAAEEYFGVLLEPVVVEHRDYPWACASLDAKGLYGDLVVEIKCPGEINHLKTVESKEVPEHYQLQCQWQMYVSSVQLMYYMSYFEGTYEIIEVKRNDLVIEECIKAAYEFHLCVINDIAPEATLKDKIFISSCEFVEYQKEYIVEYDLAKKHTMKAKELKKKMEDCTDGGDCEGDLITLVWNEGKKTIDHKKLIEDFKLEEHLSKYTKTGAPFSKINIKNRKES